MPSDAPPTAHAEHVERVGPPDPPPARRTLVALFAHPDDETFSMGATLPRYAAEGVAIHLLCATDGDGGRVSSVAVGSRAELGRLRRAELHAAARLLGVRTVTSLGLSDGALPAADADALAGAMVRHLRTHRPQVVATFGPEGAPNAHRDHRALSRAATAAFFLAALPTAYPEQLDEGLAVHAADRLYYVAWDAPAPGDAITVHSVPPTARLDARPWDATKRAAFDAHRTQHDLRDRFEAIAMRDDESFALAAGRPQSSARVSDLFAGLR
jgi:LmbE family N-acetylglucosaminyl deacetylase